MSVVGIALPENAADLIPLECKRSTTCTLTE